MEYDLLIMIDLDFFYKYKCRKVIIRLCLIYSKVEKKNIIILNYFFVIDFSKVLLYVCV